MYRRATIKKYEGQFRNYVIPEFGNKHVDEITTHDVISFVRRLLAGNNKNKALSQKTIQEIRGLLAKIRKFSILHVKTLSEILGHSSVNMTLNRYVYPSIQTKHWLL